MSRFQIGLAILGGLLFATVVVWNIWSLRRNSPKRPLPQRPTSTHSTTASQQATRRDPGLTPPAPESASPFKNTVQLLEPYAVEPVGENGPTTEPVTTSIFGMSIPDPEEGGGLDRLLDSIAPMAVESMLHAIPGAAALTALAAIPGGARRVGSKPISIEGKNQITALWERPQIGQHYRKFQGGIQLANRAGPLTVNEFSGFIRKLQVFADNIGARPEFPDMAKELERAQLLDTFASEHDLQLVFMLRARKTAWTAAYVVQHAAWQGFIHLVNRPGQMVLPTVEDYSASSTPMLLLVYDTPATVSFDPKQSALQHITISLDVPRVSRDEKALARLSSITTTLCQEMDGILCDSEGNPLSEDSMQSIASALEDLYDSLEKQHLPAGSALSKRLFS